MRWSSKTRRLLPIPGTPTSVRSCGVEGVLDDSELALAPDELRSRVVRDVYT
jgi:hypothetical protein